MALKAKRRTKSTIPPPHRSGIKNNGNGSNGFHNREWQPGDPPELHPLAGAMGAFKDDPLWDDFLNAMKEARRLEREQDDLNYGPSEDGL